MLKHVLKCGADVNIMDSNGWTPLHSACQYGDLEIVKILVEDNANINKFSNTGYYPVHIAALNNHDKVIEYLCNKGKHKKNTADLECETDKKCTPLHLAAKKGHVGAIKKILDLGGNIYSTDLRGWTALHFASFNGHSKAVYTLCVEDSDKEKLRKMKTSRGKPAREIAMNDKTKFAFNSTLFILL